MRLTDIQANIRALGAQIKQTAEALARSANDASTPLADVEKMQGDLKEMQARMAALQASYDIQLAAEGERLPEKKSDEAPKGLRDILKSNEYARAFAHAIRNGITPKKGRGMSECKVLYDAMTIGGGDPVGEDGGFLVPEDIDHTITELRRTLNPLAELFGSETVTAPSGWRVQDTAPTTGMASVNEMGTLAAGEQPTFAKISYTLTKYGMYIPVSNELASDEIAGLFAYLARWFARKLVITENTLLLGVLDDLTATEITEGEELAGIKTAINKALDPMISANAIILTNQSGFDVLDNMTDGNGRPLLHPDPQTGTPRMTNGKTVHMVADAVLANAGGKAPLYIGDFRQYATLFSRAPLEIVSTDIGGDAFRSDSVEVRGIKRMGVSKFDTAAAVLRTVTA